MMTTGVGTRVTTEARAEITMITKMSEVTGGKGKLSRNMRNDVC